ncbi:hypothetical protein SAMN05444336_103517 [Albimonas donghaensis]|uniref:Uncharacterized protein n=1 Tax=Albimonas donghaensis TaxID=356660 RepID=A0A1H2ZHL0_9RHOB|nr:hypothetical protein SAMN05444336_103517 [Albimonas donghaensis]
MIEAPAGSRGAAGDADRMSGRSAPRSGSRRGMSTGTVGGMRVSRAAPCDGAGESGASMPPACSGAEVVRVGAGSSPPDGATAAAIRAPALCAGSGGAAVGAGAELAGIAFRTLCGADADASPASRRVAATAPSDVPARGGASPAAAWADVFRADIGCGGTEAEFACGVAMSPPAMATALLPRAFGVAGGGIAVTSDFEGGAGAAAVPVSSVAGGVAAPWAKDGCGDVTSSGEMASLCAASAAIGSAMERSSARRDAKRRGSTVASVSADALRSRGAASSSRANGRPSPRPSGLRSEGAALAAVRLGKLAWGAISVIGAFCSVQVRGPNMAANHYRTFTDTD